jgi:ABC-2 type transport system ATP-binding protein
MNHTNQLTTTVGPAITLQGVSKSYKHFTLRNINLTVPCGTVMGLIGPNGSGKSTTMRIMLGLVNPDSGSVSALGNPVSSSDSAAKQNIGYFSDDMRLYKPESIGWHMQFIGSLYPTWDDAYAEELLNRFGLIKHQTIKGLSHGQRVKTLMLLILARKPKLLILDEPTNGLDPVAKHEILTELMRIIEDEERTILYSSHDTQDIEKICDSITFIDRGEIVAQGNRDEFLEQWRRIRLQAPTAQWTVPTIPGLKLESSFHSLRVLIASRFEPVIVDQLRNTGAVIESIEPMSLEEIFVHTVIQGREG